MIKSLKGKTALITGSSRGVGQQIAKGLASLDADIILHARNEENLAETIDLLKDSNVKLYTVSGDLMSSEGIDTLVERVNNLVDGVDILYNNAAIMMPYRQNYWEHTSDDWAKTFQVNVYAMYALCAAFIPQMIEIGFGRVINLTSGIKDEPELVPYSASKAAVDKLTQDLAAKLENTGVRINRLDPGWLKTDMGGPNAWNEVEDTLPGALVPALIEDDGPNGELFSAIELRDVKL